MANHLRFSSPSANHRTPGGVSERGHKMADERTQRVAAAAKDLGADWAVLTSPDTVYYAAQHAGVIETGPSPFAGGPSIAFVSAADSFVGLVVNNLEEAAARESSADQVCA